MEHTPRRGAARAAAPKVSAEQRIMDRLPELVEGLLSLAVGVRVMEDEDGPIYEKPPSRLAAEYLINRVLGKPTEKAQTVGAAAHDEIDKEMKQMGKLSLDDLVQLHSKTLGES